MAAPFLRGTELRVSGFMFHVVKNDAPNTRNQGLETFSLFLETSFCRSWLGCKEMKHTGCYTFVRMNASGLLILVSCLVLFPTVGTAELYQWTDAQGNLHITDTPPPVSEKKPVVSSDAVPPASATADPVPQKKSSAKHQASVGQTKVGARHSANPAPAPQPSHDGRNHSLLGGLHQTQATVISPWQIFEGNPASTKAAVRRWKDERGIDHFVDAVPDTRRRPGSS
jgi:hypothetical protein